MSSLLSRSVLPVLFCAAAASGCGGGSATAPLPQPIVLPPADPAPPAPPPASVPPSSPAPAALVASSESLALAVSGQARQFVITNVGGQDALNLSPTTTLPVGTSIASDCTTLAPGARCTLSVTPGATPSAAPGDTALLPVELRLAGSNTNTLALSVWVLDIGSVYQGGLVFDIDDGTPAAGGIGGKVLALRDVRGLSFKGSPDYVSIAPAASSATDGAANTAAIVAQFGPPPFSVLEYPAWACHTSDEAGFTDWYLPAICELGYDSHNMGTGCGTSLTPTLPNVRSNLVDRGYLTASSAYVWSSTQLAPSSTWKQMLGPGSAAQQTKHAVFVNEYARCARALTP